MWVKFIPSHVPFISKSNSENCIKIHRVLTKIYRLLFMADGVVPCWKVPGNIVLWNWRSPWKVLEFRRHVVLCQVMAVATLERCYNNAKVFTGVVKIRKGETVRMITVATNIDAVKAIFSHFVSKVSHTQFNTNSNSYNDELLDRLKSRNLRSHWPLIYH